MVKTTPTGLSKSSSWFLLGYKLANSEPAEAGRNRKCVKAYDQGMKIGNSGVCGKLDCMLAKGISVSNK